MPITTRLLGLAFASADALVEIDAQGRVGFALGAGPAAGQDVGALWTGKPLTELLHQGDHVLQTLMNSKAGARSAPLQILLTAGADRVRRASIRAFVLPQLAPAISC
ncbi:cyclic diguanylate phosphodiesterase (EAL) domain protein, partial [Streptomyces coelicoflavus ZG0656]